MGIVVRTPYVSGNDVTAEGQNANEDLLANEFNGNIDNANIKASAGIVGTKLADAPNGVPTAKINDGAITTAKIENDAVDATKLKDDAAVDANRAVTTNHIRNQAILNTKIKYSTYSWAPGGTLLAGAPQTNNTGLGSVKLPIGCHIVKASVPLPDQSKIIYTLWYNTGSGTWYQSIAIDTDVASVTLAGLTFEFRYIEEA